MGDLSDFLQDNWFELGSLIAQFGILAVIAWYARTKLKSPVDSHRQVESSATLSEPPEEFALQEPVSTAYQGVGRMLSPMPAAASLDPVPTPAGHWPQHTSRCRTMIRWLRAPITSGTRVRSAT